MNILAVLCYISILLALPTESPSSKNIVQLDSSNLYEIANAEVFKTKSELFDSELWDSLLKKKVPQLAQSTVIFINETNSVLHFSTSETQTSDTKFPFWLRKNRVISLVEVQYGAKEAYQFHDVPISSCISSRLSSGGASYSQSYQVGQSLTLDLVPSLSLKLMEIGATFSVGTNDLILSLSNTGSITCTANPGKRTQVFGSFDYIHFPNARKRKLTFSKGDSDFKAGNWISVLTTKPNFKEYGAMFYDLSKIPEFYCVDNEEYLACKK